MKTVGLFRQIWESLRDCPKLVACRKMLIISKVITLHVQLWAPQYKDMDLLE